MQRVFLRDFEKHGLKKVMPTQLPCLILMLPLILCLGCSANHALPLIDSFSDATVDFTEKATKVYQLIDESTIERQIIEIATLSSEEIEKIDRDAFGNIKGILEKNEAFRVRKEVLDLLGQYAEALGKLGVIETEHEINEASKNLYSALVGLDSTSVQVLGRNLTGERAHIKLISTEIDAIGMAIAKGERVDGIKRVVLLSDSTIQLACGLLSGDVASLAKLAKASMDTEVSEWIRFYKIRAPKLNFEQRIKLAKKVYEREKMMREAERMFFSISEASKRVGKAHSSLKVALMTEKPSSRDLLREINELLNLTLAIDQFYEGLE